MPKAKPNRKNDRPGLMSRARTAFAGAFTAAGAGATLVFRAFTGVLLVALLVAWVIGRQPLQEAVASSAMLRPQVAFTWPTSTASPTGTWLPEAVQQDLILTALNELSEDPFDRDSLERARARLLETGWFSAVHAVVRRPGNTVRIDADWRVPVAVVLWRDQEFLVSRAGEVLRLPPFTPVARGSMPVIANPHMPPPADPATRALVYGRPWTGGDIQSAVGLHELLRADPALARLRTVDLADYMKTGHLTIVSDLGCRIVWGSPANELAPGEVPPEKRLARLRDLVAQRADGLHKRIEVFPPVVLVDTTAGSGRP